MIIETYRNAPYGSMLNLQHQRHNAMCEQRRQGLDVDKEWIMAVEHRDVYTLGRRADMSNMIDPEYARLHAIDVVQTDRGGDITYHGPGQITLYPLIDLLPRHLGVKDYVALLEQAVIDTAAEYGIESYRIEGATGVWSGPRERPAKLCAIGIKCSRFLTMHGLALNITTDLNRFDHINPCGFAPGNVTSLARLTGRPIEWCEATDILLKHLLSFLSLP